MRRYSASDEKTAIQALDRKDPILPLSPGRAERHGFDISRHGTLSLYAAFNTKTGEVLGKTTARHTAAELRWLPDRHCHDPPRGKEIHVIADNHLARRASRHGVPGAASQGTPSIHPDLLLLARSSPAVVQQDRPRRHRARGIYFRLGPEEEALRYIWLPTTSRPAS